MITAVYSRPVLLSVVVMIYLGWIVEAHPGLGERLIAFGQPPPNSTDFVLYRLLTGLTEAMDLAMLCIDACFWLRRTLL